ncbi:hypothetical protein ABWH88_12935 [Marinobacter adhaerens]|uniref:Uncharacterized protein n=1 Tax=Marinobacter adhaerens TaxID=1033846 RepID=A0ABX8IL01_9GAMM|nr:hypothetical protein [Marinobacter adhaerens]MBW4977760.1 hypothetical protein [Marinobacter adhaerens]QWV13329.1 hypothetical protein KQ249_01530 [Marinobacter adhaerens]
MEIKDYAFRETICALILGGVPSVLVCYFPGDGGLIAFFKSLKAADFLIWYWAALFVGHLLLSAVDYWWFKPNETINSFFRNAHDISEQVGFSLLSVYRVIAGALILVPLILLGAEYSMDGLLITAAAYGFALAAISACCLLSWIQRKTADRRPRTSNQ